MSFFPCAIDRHRYTGPAWYVYPAVVCGGQTDRARLRVCADHFTEMIEDAGAYSRPVVQLDMEQASNDSLDNECFHCESFGPTHALFVSAFPKNGAPIELYGRLCAECAAGARQDLHIAP